MCNKLYTMSPIQKTKRERFETVASKRVQNILDGLEVLSKCANKNNYEYSKEDVQKMFKAIKDKVKNTEAIFNQKSSPKGKTFSF
jgi:hypothetical protein